MRNQCIIKIINIIFKFIKILIEILINTYTFGIIIFLTFSYYTNYRQTEYYYLFIKMQLILITILASLSGLSYRASSSNSDIEKKEFFNLQAERLFLGTLLQICSFAILIFYHEDFWKNIPTIIKTISLFVGSFFFLIAGLLAAEAIRILSRFFIFRRDVVP